MSVIVVNIQLSSPIGVRRASKVPGSKSTSARAEFVSNFLRLKALHKLLCIPHSNNHRNAIRKGVVRQAVNKSAGKSGFIGSSSPAEHAARTMKSRINSLGVDRC